MISENLGDTNKKKRSELDTYVFIDVSNIRQACKKGCGFSIDFLKFYKYLAGKYSELKDVRYYEGVAPGDQEKMTYFEGLRKGGLTVCSLERKTYISPAKYKTFSCPKCLYNFRINVAKKITKMKSNVDVYLVSEMLEIASVDRNPKHFMLVSCDGDYAEAIRAIFRINPNAVVTILATPKMERNNFLSMRLRSLMREFDSRKFIINDISKIAKKISE